MDATNCSEIDGAASVPRAGKACDVCHARKIKCDRKSPRCSACVTAGHLSCTVSARPPEKRKRVASVVDEQEIKSVSERLANLERTLSTLVSSQNLSSNTDYTLQRKADNINITRLARDVEDDYHPPFEGASSFSTHSKQVSLAFGSVTTSPSATLQNGESPSSSLLTGAGYSHDGKDRSEDNYELPSRALVLKVLRAARTDPKRYFDGIADLNLANLTDMCQRVFFPIEDFSSAFMIVVNVCLWKTFDSFGERDLHEHRIDEREFEQAKMVCKRTLDRAVRCTPLILDHSYIQIQAILLLSLFLIETSRPSLALTFASTCARLCQGAGYHCIQFSSPDPQAKQKIVMFWVVFSIDRGLSLNFGRSPSLQDYDATAGRPTFDEAKGNFDMFACSTGVDLAHLQGDIYRLLYSSRAQSEDPDVRAQHAQILADRMIALRQQLLLFETNNDAYAIRMIEGYDLVLHSHLALIYQAMPSDRGNSPLHFSHECIIASRAAMEGYNAAWGKYGSPDDTAWKTVLNWIYLFSPFTAFIVLFGTVITLKSEADLKLMEDSVTTLKAAVQLSPGISKLHDACESFLHLAQSYMQQILRDGNGQPVLGSFDMTSRDWNQLLDEWELGLAGENAREMSTFLSGGIDFSEFRIP